MLFFSIVKLLVYPSRLVIQCCWPSSCMLLVNGSSLSIQISQQFITMKFTLFFLLQFLCFSGERECTLCSQQPGSASEHLQKALGHCEIFLQKIVFNKKGFAITNVSVQYQSVHQRCQEVVCLFADICFLTMH